MENKQEEFIVSPNAWVTKNRTLTAQAGEECDLIITEYIGPKSQSTTLRFLNKSNERISKTNYIVVQPVKSRLYFMEADMKNGFKVSGHSNRENENKYLQLKKNRLPVETAYQGMYHLEYDATNKLYFIDVRNKIN